MTLYTVIVWRTPVGNINVTTVFESARLQGETDQKLLDRIVEKQIQFNPKMAACQVFFKPKSEVRAITNSVVGGKRKRTIDASGNITIDNTIETPNETHSRLKISIKSKLKSIGLTDEEMDRLIK